MKTSIKKLRSCAFNKAIAPSGFTGQSIQHTNKLVCDHPEMKIGWIEKSCEKCESYRNRNISPEPTLPPSPEPAPIPTPEPTLPPSPEPTPIPPSEPPPSPKKSRSPKAKSKEKI